MSLQDKLERLYTLLNNGTLTEPEFNQRKASLVEEFISGDNTKDGAEANDVDATTAEEDADAGVSGDKPNDATDLAGPRVCCRLRGLPFTASVKEVKAFLDGLSIDWESGGIKLVMDPMSDNICSGFGYVRFVSEAEAQKAAQTKDRQPIDHRYIEVQVVTTGEMAAGIKVQRPEAAMPRYAPYPSPMGKGKGKGLGPMVAGGFAPPGGLAFGKGQSLGLGMVPPGLAPLGKGKGYPDLGGMGKGKGVFPGMQRGGLSSPATGWNTPAWNPQAFPAW